MSEDTIALTVRNYPADGDLTLERKVIFGPGAAKLNVLIEFGDEINITLGNGPSDSYVQAALPVFLRDLAESIERIEDDPEEFAAKINKED